MKQTALLIMMSDDQCEVVIDHLSSDAEFGILESERAWIHYQAKRHLKSKNRILAKIVNAKPILESKRWRVICQYEEIENVSKEETEGDEVKHH